MTDEKEDGGRALSFRIPTELADRLKIVSQRTTMKEADFARRAVSAAVVAAEENDYKLVLPFEFVVRRVPMEHPALRRGPAKTGS